MFSPTAPSLISDVKVTVYFIIANISFQKKIYFISKGFVVCLHFINQYVMTHLPDKEPMPFGKFIKELKKRYDAYKKKEDKTESHIAVCMKVSNMTVRNCFDLKEQIVSDKTLTTLINCIEAEGEIMWRNGERFYYLKTK